MEKVTIEAREASKDGVKGALLGSREYEKPTTWEEFLDTFDQKQIMGFTWKSFAIEEQRKMRDEVRKPSKDTDAVKAFRRMSPAEQAALIEKAKKSAE